MAADGAVDPALELSNSITGVNLAREHGSVEDFLKNRSPVPLNTVSVPAEKPELAYRFDYDLDANEWVRTEAVVEVAFNHFAEGAMRRVYRLRLVDPSEEPQDKDHRHSAGHVAKKYFGEAAASERPEDYFADVAMLCEAAHLADLYNARDVPKKVHYPRGFVIQCREREAFYACEPMISLRRKFERHNNNDGWCDSRATPQTFSHFTYEITKQQKLLVDVQGTGDDYTDPQFHSVDEEEYGKGNLGPAGIQKFFQTHVCNKICEHLKLPKRGNFSVPPPRKQTPVHEDLQAARERAAMKQHKRNSLSR